MTPLWSFSNPFSILENVAEAHSEASWHQNCPNLNQYKFQSNDETPLNPEPRLLCKAFIHTYSCRSGPTISLCQPLPQLSALFLIPSSPTATDLMVLLWWMRLLHLNLPVKPLIAHFSVLGSDPNSLSSASADVQKLVIAKFSVFLNTSLCEGPGWTHILLHWVISWTIYDDLRQKAGMSWNEQRKKRGWRKRGL